MRENKELPNREQADANVRRKTDTYTRKWKKGTLTKKCVWRCAEPGTCFASLTCNGKILIWQMLNILRSTLIDDLNVIRCIYWYNTEKCFLEFMFVDAKESRDNKKVRVEKQTWDCTNSGLATGVVSSRKGVQELGGKLSPLKISKTLSQTRSTWSLPIVHVWRNLF